MRSTVIRTARLTVTTWEYGDATELARLHSDPAVMAFIVSGVQGPERTRARVRRWMAEHEARGWSKWRVADRRGRLVGRAGFSRATVFRDNLASRRVLAKGGFDITGPDPRTPGLLRYRWSRLPSSAG